jgi:hypothetical protein
MSSIAEVNGLEQAASGASIEGAVPITLRINGEDRQLRINPRTTLLDCIRESILLTGTKKGCDHRQCGACTVHVNGRRVVSCLSLALLHAVTGECSAVQVREQNPTSRPSIRAATSVDTKYSKLLENKGGSRKLVYH